MDTIKLREEFFPGQWEYFGPDFSVSAWEAPSGNGITCHVFRKHYPYTSVAIRGLKDIAAAESAATYYMNHEEAWNHGN